MTGSFDDAPLSEAEARVLGCLMEKQRTTPDQYPLSLSALVAACNQSTNRAPVVSYDELTVQRALDGLRARELVRREMPHGGRAIKFAHRLDEELELGPAPAAVLGVLLLRGAQTAGELKARTERWHRFADLGEVEAALAVLAEATPRLVERLAREPGQKESRFLERLSSAHLAVPLPGPDELGAAEPEARASLTARVAALEDEVRRLSEEVEALRSPEAG